MSVKNIESLVHDAAVIYRTLPVLSPCLLLYLFYSLPKMSEKRHKPCSYSYHLRSFIFFTLPPTSVHHVLYLGPEGFTHLNVSGCSLYLSTCAAMHINLVIPFLPLVHCMHTSCMYIHSYHTSYIHTFIHSYSSYSMHILIYAYIHSHPHKYNKYAYL